MSRSNRIPSDWNTERADEFEQYSDGLVKSYDGRVYPDPNKNVMRFSSPVQHIRFLHYKTGRSIDSLWEEYETAKSQN